MIRFRKRVLLSELLLFVLFLALFFPFAERAVANILRKSLEKRGGKLIERLAAAPHREALIGALKREEGFFFQQVSLLSLDGELLYDSHLPRMEEEMARAFYHEARPEMGEALRMGRGYREGFSELFQENFSYVALLFEAHGQKYLLRTGFPSSEIVELKGDFRLAFALLGGLLLLFYGAMHCWVVHRLSLPIQKITDAILPYQEGRADYPPQIPLDEVGQRTEFAHLASTLNSLTQRIQGQIETLEQERLETEGILDSLGEGVIASDRRGVITFANRAAAQMLQVEPGKMVGSTLEQLASPLPELAERGHELLIEALQTFEEKANSWHAPSGSPSRTFHRAEERGLHLELVVTPLAQQRGAILVLQDKTADYKVVEMGKDFIANASHELRTPLTVLRGFAETLHDLPEIAPELLKEITEKMVRTSVRLDKLIKSLLTLTDVENFSGKTFHPLDLVQLATHAIHLLKSAHPKAEVSFKSALLSAPVFVDGDLLELAIFNLLENGVKYSEGVPSLEVEVGEEGEGFVLSVKDRGVGIPESDLPHIFGRFYTVDKARSRKWGGAGLGLSIVKTIVEKHGGRVGATSKVKEGSVFILHLPRLAV